MILRLAMVYLLLWTPTSSVCAEVPAWLRGELGLAVGVDRSSGDYGATDDTEVSVVPLTVSYLFDDFSLTRSEMDRIELKMMVPYIWVEGPGTVISRSDGVTAPLVPGRRNSEHGLGDVLVQASYLRLPDAGSRWPFLQLTGKVKLPIADEDKRLGTGEADYTIQLLAAKRVGRFSGYATLGYRWMGEPSGRRLDNRRLASIGVGFRPGQRWSGGVFFSWREAASPGAEDARDLIPYLSILISPRVRLQPYATIGLSEGSPDLGLGVQLRWRFSIR